jgi:hypothetical protein
MLGCRIGKGGTPTLSTPAPNARSTASLYARCTPAMAAGVTSTFWTVRDLIEMIET